MKILLLLSLFFSSELLGYDPNNNRLFDRAEKLCKENPDENLAVILTKTTIPAEDRARTGTRIRRKERVYYKYRTQKVEKLNLVSNTHFIGKYFRILDKDTYNPIELSCKNLRASNVYFHLNYIHELFLDKMIPYFPKAVKERMEKHYPIDVRINLEKTYSFVGKFSEKEKMHNMAITTCGAVEKNEEGKFAFNEKPEVLFFAPKWTRGKWGFAPICWIGSFRNESPCSKETAMDMSLIPANIFHEYLHLLTDSFMNECRTNMLGESYSIFSSLMMSPLKEAGTKLPGMVNHRYNEARFENKLEPYSEDAEAIDTLWIREGGNFAYRFMGKVYDALKKELQLTHIEAWRLILQSAFQLRIQNGNKVPTVKELPKALTAACQNLPKQKAQCKKTINKVSAKYF